MFRSEWLKDAKFKSLLANDRTDWCLKERKAETESARQIVSDSDTYNESSRRVGASVWS